MPEETSVANIDVDKPLFDVNTFTGRFQYYAWMTDPRTVLLSSDRLLQAKQMVDKYRAGEPAKDLKPSEVHYNMKLYNSAFHPDTGELQNFAGRMSFQVPGGMLITGGMLAFYRTVPAVVLWQFLNQSFNAVVNYTNRNANSPTSVKQLGVAYVSATTSALIAAIGCKNYWSKKATPILQRYVPFAAVAAANCVNIPLMRQNEILHGIEVKNADGEVVGQSRLAAVKGISEVIFSRITMAAPGMLVLPIIMQRLEKLPAYKRIKWINAPFQTLLVGCFLCFMVPTACAIFPQQCGLDTSTMRTFEPELYEDMVKRTNGAVPKHVYFNKGL
ncbi:sideroflexin-2 [Drosophila sulfurigaster albostrigata]|uniref:sideroflexin-2 n=1 Tax=Drosophila sulfurigaster albostrigata TaxID=89887 RepID=UPI002D21D33B|nr:sideroflexin-2 [Drosophila sulfurigaster albostrigata]XP_062137526.1 sideroflexin-2 [Drosophila sulfurigaster albostrigata]